MSINRQLLINDYAKFTNKSLNWCIDESESSVTFVTSVLDALMDDASRISKMSKESLKALKAVKKEVNSASESESRTRVIKLLKSFSEQDGEIVNTISPIIESMQFQDRIRQRMENLEKMVAAWQHARVVAMGHGSFTEQQRIDFGSKLLEATTMADERKVIRNFIPGLPEEEEAQEDVMLF